MNRLRKRMVLKFLLLTGIMMAFLACKKVENISIEQKLGDQFSVLLQKANTEYDAVMQQGGKRFFPRSITEEGQVSYVASGDWCSGFFPGCLWLMAELTADKSWQQPALKYTLLMEKEQWNGGTHDMGFKMMCSYGNALRATQNADYSAVVIQSAKTLCTRFNETVGSLRSWDHNADRWSFPVIIDNMMNLELLFKATELPGDSSFYFIAVKHANTTIKNHFRSDTTAATMWLITIRKQVRSMKRSPIRAIPTTRHGHVAKLGACMVSPCVTVLPGMKLICNRLIRLLNLFLTIPICRAIRFQCGISITLKHRANHAMYRQQLLPLRHCSSLHNTSRSKKIAISHWPTICSVHWHQAIRLVRVRRTDTCLTTLLGSVIKTMRSMCH